MAADGAANLIFDEGNDILPPHCIHGDLDSLRPEVAASYGQKGVQVTADKDQDSENDMGKCLSIMSHWSGAKKANVLVLGAFGGRVDHEFANLNAALRHTAEFNRLVLLGNGNVAEVLLPGVHHIGLGKLEGPTCGLIPIFGRCPAVVTKGLRWNLNQRALAFGECVSSSNEVVDDLVEVQTTNPLLWTHTYRMSTSLKPLSLIIPPPQSSNDPGETSTPPAKVCLCFRVFLRVVKIVLKI